MNNKIIGLSYISDYDFLIKYLIEKLTNEKVVISSDIKKTLELGSKYSPDGVCNTFKYIIGTFIEELENGANILVNSYNNCVYGYYFELQKKILEDLGYKFEFYTFSCTKLNIISNIYNLLKKFNSNLSIIKYIYNLFLGYIMIIFMNKIDKFISSNIGFEIKKGSFERIKKGMIKSFYNSKNLKILIKNYYKYKKKFKNIKIDKPKNCVKVGLIGNFYSQTVENKNYFIEKELANMNMVITRYNDLPFSFITKLFKEKYYLLKIRKYCKYKMNYNSMKNLSILISLINKKYDGIVYIRSVGCIPEIATMNIIDNICKDKNVPLMYLIFNEDTSELEIKTRLKAFKDMLIMNANK